MSTTNFITNLLNLKDPNIDFSNCDCFYETIKGIETMIITAILKNKPSVCPHCGGTHINIHNYETSNIKIPAISGFNAILRLKKQRYICKHCNKTFVAKTSIIKRNCFISNNTKNSIANYATKKLSEKDIAYFHNVSHVTVNRVINAFRNSYKINHNYLPPILCFDEFKSTKDISGAMSFIFADTQTHKIIDVVEDRRYNHLEKYFFQFTKKARSSVKFVVMDMYSPYMKLVNKCFPRAEIIIDRFHIVNLISRALNKTRIKIMNTNKTNYNKLKKYWKLILKWDYELDTQHLKYQLSFRKPMTQKDIVNYLVSLDDELSATYKLYQNLLHCIKYGNANKLNRLIDTKYDDVSTYMQTAIKSLKKYSPYILNSVKYKYSNGTIEGINNKIKTIKRIAFGYRSFYNFRNRILIMNNLILTNNTIKQKVAA